MLLSDMLNLVYRTVVPYPSVVAFAADGAVFCFWYYGVFYVRLCSTLLSSLKQHKAKYWTD